MVEKVVEEKLAYFDTRLSKTIEWVFGENELPCEDGEYDEDETPASEYSVTNVLATAQNKLVETIQHAQKTVTRLEKVMAHVGIEEDTEGMDPRIAALMGSISQCHPFAVMLGGLSGVARIGPKDGVKSNEELTQEIANLRAELDGYKQKTGCRVEAHTHHAGGQSGGGETRGPIPFETVGNMPEEMSHSCCTEETFTLPSNKARRWARELVPQLSRPLLLVLRDHMLESDALKFVQNFGPTLENSMTNALLRTAKDFVQVQENGEGVDYNSPYEWAEQGTDVRRLQNAVREVVNKEVHIHPIEVARISKACGVEIAPQIEEMMQDRLNKQGHEARVREHKRQNRILEGVRRAYYNMLAKAERENNIIPRGRAGEMLSESLEALMINRGIRVNNPEDFESE